MARIAVAGFRHETNSFSPTLATYDEFERGYSWPPLTRGEGLVEALRGYNLGISGFLAAAEGLGHAIVPLIWGSASPSGPVTEDAYERIVGLLIEDLEAGGPFDAVYLGLHGAMVAEHVDDGEGELLERVRRVVGPDVPVVATLDYHTNMTARMMAQATALLGYRTYPHVDMAATGERMAGFLDGLLRAPGPVHGAWRQIPFLIPLTDGCTTVQPTARIVARLPELEADTGTLLSFAAGFPAADFADCGASVYAFGPDQAAATHAVERLAEEIEAAEREWHSTLLQPDEAVREALRLYDGRRPVVLADVQDNPGAGGTADTIGLLKALVAAGVEDAALGLVYDPHVATIAHRCGEGAEVRVSLGGKHGVPGDNSLDATFTVDRKVDGRFTCTGPFYGGARMELAPMACLRIGGVRVVVAGKKVQAADREMFRHVGIVPEEQRILALKSSVHFRADFEPIAAAVLLVAAPGPMVMDPARLPFTRLRSGLRLSPGGRAFAG